MSTLLVIDDDPTIQDVFRQVFQKTPLKVHVAGSAAEALNDFASIKPDVVILDIMLPGSSGLKAASAIQQIDARIPVIFITADDTSSTAIEAMKAGAFDYLLKPLDFNRVQKLVERAIDIRRRMQVPVRFNGNAESSVGADALVGRCPAMQEVYKAIGRVAPQNVTVLIHGESGTGKELVARAIYQHSPRALGKFLAVNCAAIPEALLESELFGHEKGSFTGADAKRIGKFEQCSGGTLFLDEIGDMAPLLQSKLLRALQEQKFERVGGNETIQTDVRIVAATNRDLEAMVAEGKFRADLYYRLNGFTISLPPLRQRGDDIIVLLEQFLHHYHRELGKDVQEISPEALELFMSYDWPGNVRELQSVLKQALLQATGPVLMPDFLPQELRPTGSPSFSDRAETNGVTIEKFVGDELNEGTRTLYADALAFMERRVLTGVLRHTGGNQSHASRILGITRSSLRTKIRMLNITIDSIIKVADESPDDEPSLVEAR